MEPGDLFIPIDSLEEEATLTCDARGVPPPQYRYLRKQPMIETPFGPLLFITCLGSYYAVFRNPLSSFVQINNTDTNTNNNNKLRNVFKNTQGHLTENEPI